MSEDSSPARLYRARTRARHLKALMWGRPEGPSLEALPDDLQPVARLVDRIGDDLARFRVSLFGDGVEEGSPVPQVRLIAEVLAERVVPDDLEGLPDRQATWVRSDLEGEAFPRDALNAALLYYAEGGEPHVFRDRGQDEPSGRPALQDLRALQRVSRELAETAAGAEDFGLAPVRLIEDFVRMHWSNDPGTRGLVGLADAFGEEGSVDPWEEHPLGLACFAAVRAVRHLPVEGAEYEPEAAPGGPAERGSGRGAGWTPPAP